MKRVSPHEAERLLREEGYVYIDVRSVPEFEAGHPRGAFNVPLQHQGPGGMTPNPDFLAAMRAHFSKDAKLVVGCKMGGRSKRAAAILEEDGFTTIVDQKAGFSGATNAFGQVDEQGWKPAGLPVATEADAGKRWSDLRGHVPTP